MYMCVCMYVRPGAPKKETIIVGTGAGGESTIIGDQRGMGMGESKEREVGEKCTSITFFLYQCSKMREILQLHRT